MLQRPRTALAGAFACLVALAATGVISHLVAAGRARDAAALDAFTRLRDYDVDGFLDAIVHLADPLPYLLLGTALVVVAVTRERPRLALVVATVLVVAPLTARILKLATAQAREHSTLFASHIDNASWPSGHATGAMAIALCAVLVAPPRMRPLVAVLGGVFAIAIGYAVIALVWHFPSDTVGAYLVAAAWCLLGVAALRRWPDVARVPVAERTLAPGLTAALAALVAIGVVALSYVRPGELFDRAADHTTLFVSAAGIAGLAAVLAVALVRSARSS
jgi:membrane-associated phospholipid phosphatase